MKELKIGEVFTFFGTQYIVCGYRVSEGVIEAIDIWPFPGDPNMEQALSALQHALMILEKVNS